MAETQDHLGGAGVVHRPKGLHFVGGEWWPEVDEECSFSRGSHQHIVSSYTGQGCRAMQVLVHHIDAATSRLVDELDLGVEENGRIQQLVEGIWEVVKATGHFIVPEKP